MLFSRTKTSMVTPDQALPGRPTRPFPVPATHAVLGTPLEPPYPDGLEVAVFGSGCFWGAEEIFWRVDGVYTTAVGYAGGYTPNPTYEEVCTGRTGHAEVVQVVFDPARVSYRDLLTIFWETHDPTQVMRQGNDLGTQYRSVIHTFSDEQRAAAEATRAAYDPELRKAGYPPIATEIEPAETFWFAEEHHQQYLYKVPHGYRCHSATGVALPAGAALPADS